MFSGRENIDKQKVQPDCNNGKDKDDEVVQMFGGFFDGTEQVHQDFTILIGEGLIC